MNLLKHLPWIAPTVAILAVGSGFLDRINISFDGNDAEVATAAPAAPEAVVPDPAIAALAAVTAVTTPVPVIDPENASAQLAALMVENDAAVATADVDVTRTQGLDISAVQEASTQAVAAQERPAQTEAAPVGTDFFATAQANLARDRQCIDDLHILAAQAQVYFPSGGLTGGQAGIGQARVLGLLAQQCPGVTIQVSGHSDPSGNPTINQRLSLERAEAVVARVAASGIDPTLFEAVGLGSSIPSLVTGPESSAFYDRRVEFSIIETAQQASFVAPATGAGGTQFQVAACVSQLRAAVQGASIVYASRGVTFTNADLATATRLANIATRCPQARLRLVGQHSDDPRAGENGETGRLRAVILMTKLVNDGFPSGQLIVGAPSYEQPINGLSSSRVDFDVILEDL